MTRSVKDIEILMAEFCDGINYDLTSPPMRWKKDEEMPKKVGVMKEFDILKVSPANKRALNQCVDILEKKGIEVVELDINDIVEDILLYTFASYF